METSLATACQQSHADVVAFFCEHLKDSERYFTPKENQGTKWGAPWLECEMGGGWGGR